MNKLLAASAVALVAFAGMASAGNKLVVAGDEVVVPAEPVVVPGTGFSPLIPAAAALALIPLLDGSDESSTTTTVSE